MMSARDKEKIGFTLIEILVAMAISIIVIYGAFTFFDEQRKTFRQQSEQANKQANLRLGLYYLAQDIALAGYTGTPFGVEAAVYRANQDGVITTLPVRVINPINVENDNDLKDYALTNLSGEPLDAIEIWANFDPNGSFANLSLDADRGVAMIFVDNVGIFAKTVQKSDGSTENVFPVGVIVSTLRKKSDGAFIGAEYHPIISVNPSANSITLGSVLLYDYYKIDWVAPVYRRRYFVQEVEVTEGKVIRRVRWLTRRDYFAGNKKFDYLIAQGVDDLQVFLDTRDSVNSTIEMEVEPSAAVDCCQIIGVTVQISGVVHTPEMQRPISHTMSRKMRIVNADVFTELGACGACLYQL